jgi:hypothetical protein
MRGLACGILDFLGFTPLGVLASSRLTSPSSPYHSLIAIFRILTPAFLATVAVLGLNPLRTSP